MKNISKLTEAVLKGKDVREVLSNPKKILNESADNYWLDYSLGMPEEISEDLYKFLASKPSADAVAKRFDLENQMKEEATGDLLYNKLAKVTSVKVEFSESGELDDIYYGTNYDEDAEEEDEGEALEVNAIEALIDVKGEVLDAEYAEKACKFFNTTVEEVGDDILNVMIAYLSNDLRVFEGVHGGDNISSELDGNRKLLVWYDWVRDLC